jgi:hypothetical protein
MMTSRDVRLFSFFACHLASFRLRRRRVGVNAIQLFFLRRWRCNKIGFKCMEPHTYFSGRSELALRTGHFKVMTWIWPYQQILDKPQNLSRTNILLYCQGISGKEFFKHLALVVDVTKLFSLFLMLLRNKIIKQFLLPTHSPCSTSSKTFGINFDINNSYW